MEIIKIIISFLVFKILISVVTFLLISIILDIAQVFVGLIFIFFNNLGSIDCSCWVAFSTVLLITFIFFEGLMLISIISRSGILGRFILISISMLLISFVFVFLTCYSPLDIWNRFFLFLRVVEDLLLFLHWQSFLQLLPINLDYTFNYLAMFR